MVELKKGRHTISEIARQTLGIPTLLLFWSMIRYKAAVWDTPLWSGFISTGLDRHVTKQLRTLHDGKQKLLGHWHHVQCVFNFLAFCLGFCLQTLSEKITEKHVGVRKKHNLDCLMLYLIQCSSCETNEWWFQSSLFVNILKIRLSFSSVLEREERVTVKCTVDKLFKTQQIMPNSC